MKWGSFVPALSLLASCLASNLALASTATASFGVSVTVQSSCQASSTAMMLGAYSAMATNGRPAVSVSCTNPTPYIVALSAGRAARPTVTTRHLAGPSSELLRYAQLSNTEHQLNWIQQISTYIEAGTDNGAVPPLNVSSETIGDQYVAPGSYADTIIVAITY